MTNDFMSRRAEIIRLREEGATYISIGKRYGISLQQVAEIVSGKKRIRKKRCTMMRTYSVRHLTRFFNVTYATIHRWNVAGFFSDIRLGSRRDRRFFRDEIIVFTIKYLEPDGITFSIPGLHKH